MSHTPGPWTAEFERYGSAIGANGVCIATTHGTAAITGNSLPHEANARLIAAAPDMLAALRAAMHVLEHTQVTPSGVERYERAKAAITKATTETPT